MEKLTTGVTGLDDMLNGGLVKGRPYLLCGGPGAGKTILAIQFLKEGLKNGETVMYLSLEETATQLKEDMQEFEWDLDGIEMIDTIQEIEEKKMFFRTKDLAAQPEFSMPSLIDIINRKLDCCELQRLVIDSLSSVIALYDTESDARHNVMSLMNFISNTGCTALIIDELETKAAGQFAMEEFLASGVLKIHTIEKKGEILHGISIAKMRGSDFDNHIRPMRITKNGITIFPEEALFE